MLSGSSWQTGTGEIGFTQRLGLTGNVSRIVLVSASLLIISRDFRVSSQFLTVFRLVDTVLDGELVMFA